jgi:hypothetical protein
MIEKDYLPQYAAEAVKDLEILENYWRSSANRVRKFKGENDAVYKEELSKANAFEMVSSMIRHAVHIVLPLNGQIYVPRDTDYTPEECESSQALPHVMTTFEHAIDKNYYTESDIDTFPDALITLAADFKQYSTDKEEFTNPKLPGRTPVAIIGLCRFEKDKYTGARWILNSHYLTMYTPLLYIDGSTEIGISDVYTRQGLYDERGQLPNPEEGADIMRTLNGNMETIVRTCHALRVGAVLEERKEKSYTRSRTFEKKGVGGFEYHILRLPNGTVKETLASRSGNGRDGPRYHFRRAHLRTLPKGMQTFVRSCFVGNREKGVVEKTYKMEREVAA